MSLTPQSIKSAHERIAPYIHRTPVVSSGLLNSWLGHELFFKVEGLQKIGAFKIRGALNTLLSLKEENNQPKEVVAFSSGNHAQAVALASRMLGVKATIILPSFTSPIKQQATRGYGAEVVITKTRMEAEEKAKEFIAKGAYLIHPYDNDYVITGQGTACYEALQEVNPDAVFAPCGGGGLCSGTFLATQLMSPGTSVYAGEPRAANDATQSYHTGQIVRFPDTPKTIADGVCTLAISERTFHYLKQLSGFYEIPEQDIIYWTQWLTHLLKYAIEPTSAVAMAAAAMWLKEQKGSKKALIILSGGNTAPETILKIWQHDYLSQPPKL